jgi:hypothetical protein
VRPILAAVLACLSITVIDAAGSVLATPDPATRAPRVVIDGRAIAARFPAGPSVAFRHPSNWHVTTRRLDGVLDPHTLFAVSSYALDQRPRDDCDGTHGRGRPPDGVFLLVKEVLDQASLRRSLPRLPRRPVHLLLPATGRSGCLPEASVAYQFRVAKRAFFIWLSVGPRASAKTRAALSRLLDGLWIKRYPAP